MAMSLTIESKSDQELGSKENKPLRRKCEHVFDAEVFLCPEAVAVWTSMAPIGLSVWTLDLWLVELLEGLGGKALIGGGEVYD